MNVHTEKCPACGQDRLPRAWYKPGYEWLGHAQPCIRETHVSEEAERG